MQICLKCLISSNPKFALTFLRAFSKNFLISLETPLSWYGIINANWTNHAAQLSIGYVSQAAQCIVL